MSNTPLFVIQNHTGEFWYEFKDNKKRSSKTWCSVLLKMLYLIRRSLLLVYELQLTTILTYGVQLRSTLDRYSDTCVSHDKPEKTIKLQLLTHIRKIGDPCLLFCTPTSVCVIKSPRKVLFDKTICNLIL